MKKNKQLTAVLPKHGQISNPMQPVKTIEEVEQDISNAIDQISTYKRKLTEYNPPQVQKFPFFSLPDTRRELVNSALESLWQFNKSTMSTIANALETQNKNTKSLNHLICILAIAEAQLYTELNSLAKVGKKETQNVKELSDTIRHTAEQTNSLSSIQIKMALLRKESLNNLGERFQQIENSISKKADEEKLSNYVLLEKVYLKEDIDNLLKRKVDKDTLTQSQKKILDKFKRTIIVFSITSSALLAGLIASFLI